MKIGLFRLIAAAACISMIISGCANSSTPADQDDAALASPQKPVVLSQKELPDEFRGKTIIKEVDYLDLAYFPTLDDTIPHAVAAVKATVEDVSYTSIGNNAWTVIDATVNDVLLGAVAPSASLKIYAFGGYISMYEIAEAEGDRARYTDKTDEELKNTIIHQQADMEEPPLIGYQYVFFLGAPLAQMPEGSYEKLGWKYCQLQVDSDNSETLHYLPYPESNSQAALEVSDETISSISMHDLTSLIQQYHS